ncbi:hypothetical protein EDC04DRAFT_2767040 [Pisolithus marmoratus]|nr:hypothetical protein EDC04DRAFT_2767040 [Pisolithus marmoratus]
MAVRKWGEHGKVHESMSPYFEKCAVVSATICRLASTNSFSPHRGYLTGVFARIEQRYARPALVLGIRNFRKKPITMTFVAILSSLAILPVLSFVGISIFVIASIIFLAAASAIIACLVAGSRSLSTIFFLSMYSVFRFILLVRSNGRSGFLEWAMETRQHLLSTRPGPMLQSIDHLSDYSQTDDQGDQ